MNALTVHFPTVMKLIRIACYGKTKLSRVQPIIYAIKMNHCFVKTGMRLKKDGEKPSQAMSQ